MSYFPPSCASELHFAHVFHNKCTISTKDLTQIRIYTDVVESSVHIQFAMSGSGKSTPSSQPQGDKSSLHTLLPRSNRQPDTCSSTLSIQQWNRFLIDSLPERNYTNTPTSSAHQAELWFWSAPEECSSCCLAHSQDSSSCLDLQGSQEEHHHSHHKSNIRS